VHRPILKIIIAAGASVFAAAAPRAEDLPTLQQLMNENQIITDQLDKAHKAQGEIGKAKLAIDGAETALKHAQEQLKHNASGLEGAQQDVVSQAHASGCPWGATLVNQQAYVDSCNAEGARLQAMLQDIQKQGQSLEVFAQKLQEEQTKISNRTLEWAKKVKTSNADLNDLEAARVHWLERYSRFIFQSETHERLKATAPASAICDHTADLDIAAQCLQRVWDGAR
jgi:hypothetical protein